MTGIFLSWFHIQAPPFVHNHSSFIMGGKMRGLGQTLDCPGYGADGNSITWGLIYEHFLFEREFSLSRKTSRLPAGILVLDMVVASALPPLKYVVVWVYFRITKYTGGFMFQLSYIYI